jgi:peptide/nickel transport system permease protein
MMMMLGPYQRLATYVKSPRELSGGMDMKGLIEKYGLNDPYHIQYGRWLSKVVRGDLGYSQAVNRPVLEALKRRFPASLELLLYAAFPTVIVAIYLGVFASVRHNKYWDHIIRVISSIGYSLPSFVSALLLLMIFYGVLGWFPPGRLSTWASSLVMSNEFVRYTGLNTIDGILNGNFAVVLDQLRHLVLPIISLSLLRWAYLLRITRSSMLEVLKKDYIRTARSKGVAEKQVIKKHARRNALIPVVTVAGPQIIMMLAGAVITETIFNYTGVGQFVMMSATQLDYAGILGTTMYLSLLFILTNLIVDVSYAVIDPRIRLD